jgi:hypothetical protein
MSNLPIAMVPLAGEHVPHADVIGTSAPLAEVVGIPAYQVGTVETLSLEDRRTLWRLKYMRQVPSGLWSYRHKSSTDPFYWAEMGADRQGLWPSSAPSSEPEYSHDSEEDTDMTGLLSPPPEDQISIENRLRLADLRARQHDSECLAKQRWSALEEMHGWTALAKHTWSVAHHGPPRIVPPWQVYTRVSRDVWLTNIWPTV